MGEMKVGRRLVATSSESRLVFPRDGITKGDVLNYYASVAKYMVPHLRDRRLTMQRYQPNIDAPPVYQKEIPAHFPDWISRVTVPKHNGSVTHVVCNEAATLVYIANQGCLTPHVGLQRVDRNDFPDQMVFDLDPAADDFSTVRKTAFRMRELFDEIGLVAFAKTTGSRGVHLVVPLDRKLPFDTVRAFAHLVAETLVRRMPDEVTTEMLKKNRGGKLFLDTNRNGVAQTAVPAFAIRARDGAPVAVPVTWEELANEDIDARSWSVRNTPERLVTGIDPWSAMKQSVRSLRPAAERLAKLT